MKKLNPKKGDLVSVCYDGKWGRAIIGKVVQARGFAIKVEFPEFGADENENKPISGWFVRTSPQSFASFVKVESSIMKGLFGLPGDYYRVLHIAVFKVMFPRRKVFYDPKKYFAVRKQREAAFHSRMEKKNVHVATH